MASAPGVLQPQWLPSGVTLAMFSDNIVVPTGARADGLGGQNQGHWWQPSHTWWPAPKCPLSKQQCSGQEALPYSFSKPHARKPVVQASSAQREKWGTFWTELLGRRHLQYELAHRDSPDLTQQLESGCLKNDNFYSVLPKPRSLGACRITTSFLFKWQALPPSNTYLAKLQKQLSKGLYFEPDAKQNTLHTLTSKGDMPTPVLPSCQPSLECDLNFLYLESEFCQLSLEMFLINTG